MKKTRLVPADQMSQNPRRNLWPDHCQVCGSIGTRALLRDRPNRVDVICQKCADWYWAYRR